ncbi:hypothetical protein X741_22815 [Mesorhizobium sp. LNHC229A00]|nr:hypothetical protein X741_22815 [Mesorhizobium sp. LNHC229A00]
MMASRLPADLQPPRILGESSMGGGVNDQFMGDESQWLNDHRWDQNFRTGHCCPPRREMGDLPGDDFVQRHIAPAALGQQGVCDRQSLDPALNGRGIERCTVCLAQPNNTIDNRQNVLCAMIDLHQEAVLRRFQGLDHAMFGNVDLRREVVEKPAFIVLYGAQM